MGANGTKKRAAAKAHEEPKKATLRWLKVHQLRHLAPCELHFSEGYNVLLGLNGTGKTTLLELISAALRFNFAKMKKEAFFVEYEVAILGGTITASVRNEEVRPSRPARSSRGEIAALTGHQVRSELSYRPSIDLVVSSVAGKREIVVHADDSDAEIQIDGKAVSEATFRANSIYGSEFILDLLKQTADANGPGWVKLAYATMHWHNNRRFDEALGFLGVVTGTATRLRLHKEAAKPSLSAVGPVPKAIFAEAQRQSQAWEGSPLPVIMMTQEHVELLAQAAKMLGFESIELRLTHLKTEVQGPVETSSFGDLRFMLHRADGSVIPHTLLSYGQKRALSLLYYLAVNERTVIADELVDGLHHTWIVEAIEAIGDRQAFLASQNPLLLDYLEFDSADKVRQSFVQCRLEKHKKGERMIWSNMSEYDAARFFDAYQVGLQHVSEILRTKGLW